MSCRVIAVIGVPLVDFVTSAFLAVRAAHTRPRLTAEATPVATTPCFDRLFEPLNRRRCFMPRRTRRGEMLPHLRDPPSLATLVIKFGRWRRSVHTYGHPWYQVPSLKCTTSQVETPRSASIPSPSSSRSLHSPSPTVIHRNHDCLSKGAPMLAPLRAKTKCGCSGQRCWKEIIADKRYMARVIQWRRSWVMSTAKELRTSSSPSPPAVSFGLVGRARRSSGVASMAGLQVACPIGP